MKILFIANCSYSHSILFNNYLFQLKCATGYNTNVGPLDYYQYMGYEYYYSPHDKSLIHKIQLIRRKILNRQLTQSRMSP